MKHSKTQRQSRLVYWNIGNKIKDSLFCNKRANWKKKKDSRFVMQKSIILYEKDLEYFKSFKRVLKGIFIVLYKHKSIRHVTKLYSWANELNKLSICLWPVYEEIKLLLLGISEIQNEFWPRWEKWASWCAVWGQNSWKSEKIHSFLLISDFVFETGPYYVDLVLQLVPKGWNYGSVCTTPPRKCWCVDWNFLLVWLYSQRLLYDLTMRTW